eukprot:Clim_evm80s157 gene=Clim_evmTU80s157
MLATVSQSKKSVQPSKVKTHVPTEANCKMFMKNMVKIAISCIFYCRGLYNACEDFRDYHLGEHSFKILRSDGPRSRGLVAVIVDGVWDAIDKRYLKELTVGFYTDPDKPEACIERYTLSFSYKNLMGPEAQMKVLHNCQEIYRRKGYTSENLNRTAIGLLLKIIDQCQVAPILDQNIQFFIKLDYQNTCPLTYEPKHFRPAEFENVYVDDEDAYEWDCGKIKSRTHILKANVTLVGQREISVNAGSETSLPAPLSEDLEMVPYCVPTVSRQQSKDSVAHRNKCICGKKANRSRKTFECFECKSLSHLACCGYVFDGEMENSVCRHCQGGDITQEDFDMACLRRVLDALIDMHHCCKAPSSQYLESLNIGPRKRVRAIWSQLKESMIVGSGFMGGRARNEIKVTVQELKEMIRIGRLMTYEEIVHKSEEASRKRQKP